MLTLVNIYYGTDEDDVAFTDSGELSVSEDGGVSTAKLQLHMVTIWTTTE